MNAWDEVKQRTTCSEIALEHGIDAPNKKTICPFCDYKKSPSFYVTDDYFVCHHAGCGKKGDVFNLVAFLEDTDRWGALKKLADRLGIPYQETPEAKERETRSEIFKRFAEHFAIKDLQSPPALVLRARGLTDDFIQRKLMGYIPANFSKIDHLPDPLKTGKAREILEAARLPGILRDRILIPFWQGVQVVYFTGYNPEKTPKYMNIEGSKPHFGTMRGPELIITEGIFHTLLAEQAGHNVIATAGSGGDITIHRGIANVVLIFDGDDAGRAYTEKHALPIYLQGANVEVVTLEEGTDLADVLSRGVKIEDLKRDSIFQYYWKTFVVNPKDRIVKSKIYQVMTQQDDVEREQSFKILKDTLKVPIHVVRRDYEHYTNEKISCDFTTPEGFRFSLPEGYMMGDGGVWLHGKTLISRKPVFISRLGHDSQTGLQYVETRYRHNSSWKSRIIPRSRVSVAQELIKESGYGVPVNSTNVLKIIEFLDAWTDKNHDLFPHFEVVSQLGWDGPGRFIMPGRIISRVETQQVYYSGGISADAYAKQGDVKKWADTIRSLGQLEKGHIARFCIYAGFASVVLERLNLKPFIVHLHSDTSQGKTTTLRLVASIYGSTKEGDALIRWENTTVFIIRYMEMLKNIPLVIDDCTGKDKRNFDSIAYMMEAGIGKGKGDKGDPTAVVKQRTFKMGVFSSGESPILSEKSPGGASIRVWEIPGNPFGVIDTAFVRNLERGIEGNHGTAVDYFVKAFLENPEIYDSDASFIKGDLSNVEGRLAKPLDVIFKTGLFVNELFNFGFDVIADMVRVYEILLEPLHENTRAVEKIMDLIEGNVAQNPLCFPRIETNLYSNAQTIERQQGRLPNYIYGYIFPQKKGDDLAIIKAYFLTWMNDVMPVPNGGQFALNRLLEAGILKKKRVVKMIEGRQVSLLYFENLFKDESSDEKDDDIF